VFGCSGHIISVLRIENSGTYCQQNNFKKLIVVQSVLRTEIMYCLKEYES